MTAPLAPGTRVRVRADDPPGHVRTPSYVRGQSGVIERVCGDYPNPEELAYARPGLPKRALYRVRFPMHAIWQGYAGPAMDTIEVEIFAHWLEPAGP
jgi:nitrile hydratase subunit beta